MTQTAVQMARELLKDPCVSYWLKDALRTLFARDPVDALRDAELLVRVMQRHTEDVLHERSKHSTRR